MRSVEGGDGEKEDQEEEETQGKEASAMELLIDEIHIHRSRALFDAMLETGMAKRKTAKATVKKAHRIARAIKRGGGNVDNEWAVGMAAAKKQAAKRKRKRKRRA